MEKTRQVVLCMVVAFSLATHIGTALAYGAFGGRAHLVGRDGLCLQTAPLSIYYTPTKLTDCDESDSDQLWAIVDDGTIRADNDRNCLVPHSRGIKPIGTNVVLIDCTKEIRSDMKWTKTNDGTIRHDESGLVLTGKQGQYVSLEVDEGAPSQGWEATERPYPKVANIKWHDNLCLQFGDGEFSLGLSACSSRYDKRQRWVLYGDGTIRGNGDSNVCLTSLLSSSVVVSKCADMPQQRWALAADNTIGHPNTNLVMDARTFVRLSPMVLVAKRAGTDSQQWIVY